MRLTAFAICCATPGLAWEFTPGTPCRLTHETENARVELTYDPSAPLYTITIRQQVPLPDAPVFAMRFDGRAGLTISTNRHERSPDGLSVTVEDVGFGNVLNGLQLNQTATALLGDVAIPFPLAGAADPVAAFRACDVVPSA